MSTVEGTLPSIPTRWVFWCAGRPVTQGSKVAGVNPHTGKAFLRDDNRSGLELWRHVISDEARRVRGDDPPLTGPVEVHLSFALARPKSAPKRIRTWPIKRGLDVDKASRAALDALSSVLFLDDAQVVKLVVQKDWVADGGGPGVTISVGEVVGELLPTAGLGESRGIQALPGQPDPLTAT